MIATIPSAVLVGATATAVTVEVHVSNGLPGFTVVGLPDAAVRESRDRVRAALLSSGLPWPRRRVTVNLAPSGTRKGGAGLDLPIALGLLVAGGALDADAVRGLGFVGELGLDGAVRGVPGTLVLVEALPGLRVVVARASGAEAALAGPGRCATAAALSEVVARLRGRRRWSDPAASELAVPAGPAEAPVDLADVRAHPLGRRALEVAATGLHHLLLVGPSGSGKTFLARRLAGLLPDADATTARAVVRAHSAAGQHLPVTAGAVRPPVRAPGHGVSPAGMAGGGGSGGAPGELALAHGGVLLLEGLEGYAAGVLDLLPGPLDEGVVRVHRPGAATHPARFLLVGTVQPCPCGEGGPPGACRCQPAARSRHARRLAGPLLDRFDLCVRVERAPAGALLGSEPGEPTAVVAARVAAARRRAVARGVAANGALAAPRLAAEVPLDDASGALVDRSLRAGGLTARGVDAVRRVARTLADLDGVDGPVDGGHVREALLLRGDRALLWGEGGR